MSILFLPRFVRGEISHPSLNIDFIGIFPPALNITELQDLSSEITDDAGLTYYIKKAYKIGNIVTLSIYAKNETGSAISADTALMSIPSSLIKTTRRFNSIVGTTSAICYLQLSAEKLKMSANIPNASDINICITYTV